MLKKKAQFYLMAAIIIIGIIIVLSAITNYIITREEPVKIYDLSEEFKEEGSRVVDKGIYTGVDDLNNLMDKFSVYSEEKDRGSELVFVHGNKQEIKTVTYTSIKTGDVKLTLPGNQFTIPGPEVKEKQVETRVPDPNLFDEVSVELMGQEYDFELHEGENFFFVISKNSTETDEVYIAKKSD